MEVPTLRGKDRWVSCARDANESIAENRHILARGGVTTVCGATGLPSAVWRGNRTKPPCLRCISMYLHETSE